MGYELDGVSSRVIYPRLHSNPRERMKRGEWNFPFLLRRHSKCHALCHASRLRDNLLLGRRHRFIVCLRPYVTSSAASEIRAIRRHFARPRTLCNSAGKRVFDCWIKRIAGALLYVRARTFEILQRVSSCYALAFTLSRRLSANLDLPPANVSFVSHVWQDFISNCAIYHIYEKKSYLLFTNFYLFIYIYIT